MEKESGFWTSRLFEIMKSMKIIHSHFHRDGDELKQAQREHANYILVLLYGIRSTSQGLRTLTKDLSTLRKLPYRQTNIVLPTL